MESTDNVPLVEAGESDPCENQLTIWHKVIIRKTPKHSKATHVAHLPPDTVLYAGPDIGPDDLCAHPTVQQAGRRCRAQGIHALQGDIAAHRPQI